VVDHTGRFVLVANYIGGSVCVLPIQENGRLGEATDFVQHHGSSVNPDRQLAPHAHSFNIDAGNQFGFVADLGTDKIVVYKLDLDGGKLLPNDFPWAEAKAGAGPRHFDFHPDGRHAYVINELDSTVTAFDYQPESGTLNAKQTISTLPESYAGTSHCADVHVSPSGRFLYGSNRGHDSIAIFAIDENSGELSSVGHQSTQGETPRNFAIEPAGNFLLAANQDSDTIVTFKVDQETGRLDPTGQVTQVPVPVCIKMIPS
jgi:6-phosphogluconolactonase